jgi:hypothetical protein
LPADFYLVGYGRKPIPDEEFRTLAAEAIKEFSRRELDEVGLGAGWRPTRVTWPAATMRPAAFERLAAHIQRHRTEDRSRRAGVVLHFHAAVGVRADLCKISAPAGSRPSISASRITPR